MSRIHCRKLENMSATVNASYRAGFTAGYKGRKARPELRSDFADWYTRGYSDGKAKAVAGRYKRAGMVQR
jgi:hypothetical protein